MDVNTAPVILKAKIDHTHTIIWLHGLGADGHDFAPLAPSFNWPFVKFIFPHAKHRPISINGGRVMRGWYDILSFERGQHEDERGILESSLEVQKLIQKELELGIPADHIFLAGFSQGGAIALYAGLTFEHQLAGILALSTYLPIENLLKQNQGLLQIKTPILICHGDDDSVLPLFLAEHARESLKAMGCEDINFKIYPMDHSVCPEEIMDIKQWVMKFFLKNKSEK